MINVHLCQLIRYFTISDNLKTGESCFILPHSIYVIRLYIRVIIVLAKYIVIFKNVFTQNYHLLEWLESTYEIIMMSNRMLNAFHAALRKYKNIDTYFNKSSDNK